MEIFLQYMMNWEKSWKILLMKQNLIWKKNDKCMCCRSVKHSNARMLTLITLVNEE